MDNLLHVVPSWWAGLEGLDAVAQALLAIRESFEGTDATLTDALATGLRAAGFAGAGVRVDGRALDSVATLGELGIVHGSQLTTGGEPAVDSDDIPNGYAVVVVAGPESGLLIPLVTGRPVVVGRGSGAELRIDDPLLSLRHCVIELSKDGPTVADLGSTNGTVCEGCPVTEPFLITIGSHLEVGSSLLAVVVVEDGDRAILRDLDPLPDPGSPPQKPAENPMVFRLAWWRALLPLITGAGFAAMTGRWIFLAIIAVTPLVMTIDIFRRRRARDRAEVEQTRRYEADLADYWTRLADARRAEKMRRRHQTSGGGIAAWHARVRHRRVWERLPDYPDFGEVTIAYGRLASTISPESSPIGETPARLWGVPLGFPLLGTGSLAVTGPVHRARAAVRSMLIDLGTHHSPTDVKVWVLTADRAGSEWDFARWLPHTHWGSHANRLASSGPDRSRLVKELKQVTDSRAELGRGETRTLPVHIVVIDGTDLLGPAELADLLDRGPPHAVVGITIDEITVPEGVSGTLAIGAPVAGSRFESRDQPLVEGLVPCEMTPAVADEAARRLAPLRPAARQERLGRPTSSTFST
ncbi:MAG: FHA domain-containing protein [Actinomycetia bacterium]|nr:FHA domain-containing protein [Actinomycetes bacterium]